LVGWLVKVVEDGVGQARRDGQFVMMKLCSALSTYFVHFSRLWKHCIRHLVQSFDIGRAVPLQDFDKGLPVGTVVSNMRWDRLQAVICFASEIADDVDRTDPNSAK